MGCVREWGRELGRRDLQKWAACLLAVQQEIWYIMGKSFDFPSKLVFYFHLNMGGDAKVSSACYQPCVSNLVSHSVIPHTHTQTPCGPFAFILTQKRTLHCWLPCNSSSSSSSTLAASTIITYIIFWIFEFFS